MDKGQQTRNSFALRLMVVSIVAVGAYMAISYLYQETVGAPEDVRAFADNKIDRFYLPTDSQTASGTMLRPDQAYSNDGRGLPAVQ